jgi:hypothetical protein
MRLTSFVITLYFFILSIAPNMQGVQFFNLTNFIDHYQEHLARNENSDLLSFVQEHYFNRLTEFEEDHRHLPLKVKIQVATGVMNFEKFDLSPITEVVPVIIESSSKIASKKRSFYNKNVHSIWQPPQIG